MLLSCLTFVVQNNVLLLLPTAPVFHINQSYHSLGGSQAVFLCFAYIKLLYLQGNAVMNHLIPLMSQSFCAPGVRVTTAAWKMKSVHSKCLRCLNSQRAPQQSQGIKKRNMLNTIMFRFCVELHEVLTDNMKKNN